jgi:hypothetical protein
MRRVLFTIASACRINSADCEQHPWREPVEGTLWTHLRVITHWSPMDAEQAPHEDLAAVWAGMSPAERQALLLAASEEPPRVDAIPCAGDIPGTVVSGSGQRRVTT